MTNKRAASAGVSIIMGDGKAHSPSKVGDVSVTQYNRDGTTGKKILWKDVHIGEHLEYNLLSVTKYMKEGWKLTRSATETTLTKGEVVLTFDILIKTGHWPRYFVLRLLQEECRGYCRRYRRKTQGYYC